MSARPYYSTGPLTIINASVLSTRAVAPGSIHLIVTSPPYNVDIAYGRQSVPRGGPQKSASSD